ncbi:hypothetical protein PENTCL1PPCAC_10718, partial [Pristionchus entomophagus]
LIQFVPFSVRLNGEWHGGVCQRQANAPSSPSPVGNREDERAADCGYCEEESRILSTPTTRSSLSVST